MAASLTPDDLDLIRAALGVGSRKLIRTASGAHGWRSIKGAWRNRSHAYYGREIYYQHVKLRAAGLLVDDHEADYGHIAIFRVTPKGAAAVGN